MVLQILPENRSKFQRKKKEQNYLFKETLSSERLQGFTKMYRKSLEGNKTIQIEWKMISDTQNK